MTRTLNFELWLPGTRLDVDTDRHRMYDSVHEKTCSWRSSFSITAQKVEEGFLGKVDCPNTLHSPFRLLLVLQMLHLAFVVTLDSEGSEMQLRHRG